MKRREQEYLSTLDEPALGGGGGSESDPSETKADRRERREAGKKRRVAEIDRVRDSVLSEPALEGGVGEMGVDGSSFAEWLTYRKLCVGFGSLVLVTLLAGLASGSFSIAGVLLKSVLQGFNILIAISYAVVLGPLLEEMLKQSGALYLLERRPYWLKHGWQFPVIAIISAGLFATIETLMYINGPIAELSGEAYTAAVNFRWRYCTLLHVGCSLVASVGMRDIWKRQVQDGAPARLSVGYPWIVGAVVLHGLYNLGVAIWSASSSGFQ